MKDLLCKNNIISAETKDLMLKAKSDLDIESINPVKKQSIGKNVRGHIFKQ